MAAEPDCGFTTDQIARDLATSRRHLTKVTHSLSRLGYVVTLRGGGLRLTRMLGATVAASGRLGLSASVKRPIS